MKAVELTNGVVYFSSQTNFLEYTWANHVKSLWSGKIDYHSFPDGSFMSLRTELALNTLSPPVIALFLKIFTCPYFWVPTRFPEAMWPRYGPVRTINFFFRKIQRIRRPAIRTFTRRQGFHSSGKEKQEISFWKKCFYLKSILFCHHSTKTVFEILSKIFFVIDIPNFNTPNNLFFKVLFKILKKCIQGAFKSIQSISK